jgi:sugar lactone lactonase YvrE
MIPCRYPSFLLHLALLLTLTISPADSAPGDITTVAGGGDLLGGATEYPPNTYPQSSFSGDGGPATRAVLHGPRGIFVDAAGQLFISDTGNLRIRKVSLDGFITTIAGNGLRGASGNDVLATQAHMEGISGIFVDASGHLHFTELRRTRKIDPRGYITTVAGLDSINTPIVESPPPILGPLLYAPMGIYLNANGDLYIADLIIHSVIKVDPALTFSFFAGGGSMFSIGFSGDGGPATQAQLRYPQDICGDHRGNIYISDWGNQRVRKVSPDGIITTIAGNGTRGFSGDGGLATQAQLCDPHGIFVDAVGNLFISDSGCERIRMVDSTGTISTVAGNGTPGFSGDGGPATEACLHRPIDVFVDAAGNLFFSEFNNNRIRMVEGVAAPTIVNSGVFLPSISDTIRPISTDTTAPLLLSSFPANGDANIDIAALNRNGIHLAFDEPIDTTMQINLREVDGFERHWSSWVSADSLHLFPLPGQHLREGRRYQLGISQIQDLSGNIAEDIVIHFSSPDNVPPFISGSWPWHGLRDVHPEATNVSGISLGFSEPIDTTRFTYTLQQDQERTLTWHHQWQDYPGVTNDDTLVVFSPTPGNGLEYGHSYQLILTELFDLSGNRSEPLKLSFNTALDTHPPTLISSSPADGAVDVVPTRIDTHGIAFFFDEPIDTSLVNARISEEPTGIRLQSGWENDDPWALRLYLQEEGTLRTNAVYRVQLTSVQDLQGNAAEDIQLTFFTLTDSTLTDSTFTDSTFTDSTFTDSTFTDSTFTDSSRAIIVVDLDPAPGDQHLEIWTDAHSGQTVNIQLHVCEAPEIDGWSTTLEYDPTQLCYLANSFQPGRFIPGLIGLVDEDNGSVEVGGAAIGSGAYNQGDGQLGSLSFVLLSTFRDSTALRLSASRLRQVDGEWLYPSGGAPLTIIGVATEEQPSPILTLDFDLNAGDQGRPITSGTQSLFPLQLHIQHAPEISGWNATLEYDPAQLRYVDDSFQPGDFIPDLVSLVDDKEGILKVGGTLLGTQDYGTGTGPLGQLSFESIQGFFGTANLLVTDMTLRLTNGESQRLSLASPGTIIHTDHPPELMLDLDPVPGNQGQRGLEEVSIGDLIPVELHIHHAPETSGWSATLEYDPTQLRYADGSFQSGDFIPDPTSLTDDKEGVLKVGGALLGSDHTSSGNGQLGTVFFEVLENFSYQTRVLATQFLLSADAGERQRYDVEVLATFFKSRLPTITLDFDLTEGDQREWEMDRVFPGDIHRLQFNIRHAPLIDGWSATLRYDPEQLLYVDNSFRSSTFIPGLAALINSKNGEVIVGGVALGSGGRNSGAGTLGSLAFLVRDRFSGETWIEVAEISLRQPDGTLIKHQEGSQAYFFSDGGGMTAVTDIEATPSSSQLLPNFPNPFNASTALPFQIADAGPVCLEIFDIQGRQIRALFNGYLDPGHYRFVWNGADERQIPLATGIYLVRLRAGSWNQIRKIALIK